jgi:hypothetical protein
LLHTLCPPPRQRSVRRTGHVPGSGCWRSRRRACSRPAIEREVGRASAVSPPSNGKRTSAPGACQCPTRRAHLPAKRGGWFCDAQYALTAFFRALALATHGASHPSLSALVRAWPWRDAAAYPTCGRGRQDSARRAKCAGNLRISPARSSCRGRHQPCLGAAARRQRPTRAGARVQERTWPRQQ